MITTRSPLRISLGGGGTDLASYYEDHEGFLIAAAIDKYVYVNVMKPFVEGIYLKYSKLEQCKGIDEIDHPIIKTALKEYFITNQIEITTLADIPSGTGLGSSGSFTTALLKALSTLNRKTLNQEELARLACEIEIEKLKEPIGKQDQYIAAYGGINSFTFHKNGSVTTTSLDIDDETLHKLEDNLLLFYTGISRSASNILKDQKTKSLVKDKAMIQNLHRTKELGVLSMEKLKQGDLYSFAEIMDTHWQAKMKRSGGMSNNHINEWYDFGKKNGAIGGKLVGAGGGGFLMFYANDKEKLVKAMQSKGLNEVRFKFDFEGTKNIT